MWKRSKEAKAHRWYETNDPAKAIGLWSHFKTFTTTLHPIDPTRQTMGRFFNDDLAKFETRFEAYEKIAAKGWRKSSARKLQEYAEEYKHLGIAAPRTKSPSASGSRGSPRNSSPRFRRAHAAFHLFSCKTNNIGLIIQTAVWDM